MVKGTKVSRAAYKKCIFNHNLESMYVSQIIRKVILLSIQHKNFAWLLNFQLSLTLVLKYILNFKVYTQNLFQTTECLDCKM